MEHIALTVLTFIGLKINGIIAHKQAMETQQIQMQIEKDKWERDEADKLCFPEKLHCETLDKLILE